MRIALLVLAFTTPLISILSIILGYIPKRFRAPPNVEIYKNRIKRLTVCMILFYEPLVCLVIINAIVKWVSTPIMLLIVGDFGTIFHIPILFMYAKYAKVIKKAELKTMNEGEERHD